MGAIPGLREFLGTLVTAWGTDGLLSRAGLIVSPEPVRNQAAEAAQTQPVLERSSLD